MRNAEARDIIHLQMSISVQKGGLLSTIQDLGRTHFRRFGINPNGAMDTATARLINVLLGNDEREAVLEMHFPAAQIIFEASAIIALGGADFGATLDDESIENWRPFFADEGSILKFSKKTFGNRAYVSIKSGFKIEEWLGSRSTNLIAGSGGFEGRKLQAGDRIFFNLESVIHRAKFPYKISPALIPPYGSAPTIRVTAGAEFERLTGLSERDFLKNNFVISRDSDRMGFRLAGEPLYLIDDFELVSSAVDFGTIQLLPDGQMIILMADAQTSGGYPRIAHVASVDLPVLAQLGAGDAVNLELISLEEAEDLTIQFERDLSLLKVGVRLGNLWA